MGVGESVYYHCTSREGGYAMPTQSSPTAHTCRHHVAPLQLPLPWFLSSFALYSYLIVLSIDARLVYCSWPQHTPALQSVYAAFSTPFLSDRYLTTYAANHIYHSLQKQVQAGQFIFTQTSPFLPHTATHTSVHRRPSRAHLCLVCPSPWQRISTPGKWYSQRSFVEFGSATGVPGSPRSGIPSCKAFYP